MNSSWTQTYSFKVADEAGREDLVYVYTLSEESTYLDGHISAGTLARLTSWPTVSTLTTSAMDPWLRREPVGSCTPFE
jgi:hypothetical protein